MAEMVKLNGKTVKRCSAVLEHKLGRKLLRREHAHHRNHNSLDDRLENLELMMPTEHSKETKSWTKQERIEEKIDILKTLKMVKTNGGMIGKDRTILDENGQITFGYVNDKNHIVEVTIPIDRVEILS